MPTDRTATKPLQSASEGARAGNRHGLGSVYRRGRIWWIQVYSRNRARCESSKSTNRADAVRLLKTRIAELRSGQPFGPQAERLTLEAVSTMLYDDYVANERRTLRGAKRSMEMLQSFFGAGARVVDITADRLTAYVRHRRLDKAAASTIRVELAALSRAMNLAIRAGALASRPIFPTIEVRNTRTGFFEQHEFDAVHRHLPDYVKPVAKFLYLTGWRTGEVLPLKWAQVSFPAGVVRLEPGTTKNDEGRAFPFSALPELAEVLREQRLRTDEVEKRPDVRSSGSSSPRREEFLSFRTWRRARDGRRGPHPHDFQADGGAQPRACRWPRSAGDGAHRPPHRERLLQVRDRVRSRSRGGRREALSRLHQTLSAVAQAPHPESCEKRTARKAPMRGHMTTRAVTVSPSVVPVMVAQGCSASARSRRRCPPHCPLVSSSEHILRCGSTMRPAHGSMALSMHVDDSISGQGWSPAQERHQ
ncbi:MAG: tyrosine-type recombinase/integrase [Acidobacteriota bacterium]